MPYGANTDLPAPVQNSLPGGAQSRFRQVVNDRLAAGQSDEAAHRQAWYVVGHGWKKPKGNGKWTRIKKEEHEADLALLKRQYGVALAQLRFYDKQVTSLRLSAENVSDYSKRVLRAREKATKAAVMLSQLTKVMKEIEEEIDKDATYAPWQSASQGTASAAAVVSRATKEGQSSDDCPFDEALKYSPNQPRDRQGRWTSGGGGTAASGKKPAAGAKPSRSGGRKLSPREMKQLFADARDARQKLARNIRALQHRMSQYKRNSPAYRSAVARLKDMRARRAEFTREMGKLSAAYTQRTKGSEFDWFRSVMSGGLPLTRGTRRSIARDTRNM